MKLVITEKAKVHQLVAIFRHLNGIVTDVNINLQTDRLYIQGMDSSHACLIEINIEKDWFDSFEIEEGVLGVNCAMLFKIIDCWKEGQTITIYSKNYDKLSVDFEGTNTLTKRFQIPLMDIDTDIMDLPETEYQADLCLKSSELKEIVGELSIFNDTLQLNCNEEKVVLKAHGDSGTATVEIKQDDIDEYAVEEDTQLSVSYGIKYINAVCAFHKLSKYLYLHSSENIPLKLQYSLDEEEAESKNFVRFFIAPKIDD